MSTSGRDCLAEEILAVLRATAASLTPADITFRLALNYSRRLEPREVLQYLHGTLESAVVVNPNGTWSVREGTLATDLNQRLGVSQHEDTNPLTGELAHCLGLPANPVGGIMCLPPRGHLPRVLSRFSLSLRGKHQHGILDRLSTSRFGSVFFSLRSCEQLHVMEDAGVLHVDRVRRVLSGELPTVTRATIPQEPQLPLATGARLDPPHETLAKSHEPDSGCPSAIDGWYGDLLAKEKQLFAEHKSNPALDHTLTTWKTREISRLPSCVFQCTLRTILAMPLGHLLVMLNGDINGIGMLANALRSIRRTLKKTPEYTTLYHGGHHKTLAGDWETADQLTQQQYAARFRALQEFFRDHNQHKLLSVRLQHWVTADDKHFPSAFLRCQSRDFAALSFSNIVLTTGPGVGAVKTGKLLEVLDRVRNDIVSGNGPPATHARGHGRTTFDGALPQDSVRAPSSHTADPSEARWREWCDVALVHRLEHYTLGRLAPTLRYFPRSLWDVKIGTYTHLSLNDIARLPRHGLKRRRLIVDVFRSLAMSFGAIPRDSHLKVCAVTAAVRDATGWVEQHLFERRVPTLTEMRHGFIEVLLRQLDIDLGPETREMVERRLGIDDSRQSLEEIGRAFQMTTARVSQLTRRAADVLQARWPESCFLLDNFCGQLALLEGKAQHDLLCLVMRDLFGLAYRGDQTAIVVGFRRGPMRRLDRVASTDNDVRQWLKSLKGQMTHFRHDGDIDNGAAENA